MPSAPETVLLTGASSGIGRALAHRFAQAGSTCILLARSEDALHTLADTLRAEYAVDAHVLPADLAAPDAGDTVETALREQGLTVDVLVNNAGFGARGAFADLDAEEQRAMIRVNVLALTDLARRLLPGMLERNRGGILNVASTAAFQPGPYMSVYYATKAYVLSFSDGLAAEVADTSVTVTCLAPGPTRTAFVDKADMGETPLFQWTAPMSADAVAQAGYDAFRRGRPLVVPGLPNKIGAFLIRFTPRPVARTVTAWLNT
jgi:short-subunit dehydrogenase